MKIALIGATGFVGSKLLTEALNRGHQVTALVRDPTRLTTRHANLTVVTGDVNQAGGNRPAAGRPRRRYQLFQRRLGQPQPLPRLPAGRPRH
ncbi:NAD(P)-dependent oxidoreductase [Hymenobacter sp. J193]|uniref:NAD(P)-dependent oxidoreductase n=1 Tax=Hymenobacter sp. J193 TaxID=2898429 RepID=UPI002151EA1A|nr:NAD(P)H-binding protein [Hymenobacter sp. J193]